MRNFYWLVRRRAPYSGDQRGGWKQHREADTLLVGHLNPVCRRHRFADRNFLWKERVVRSVHDEAPVPVGIIS